MRLENTILNLVNVKVDNIEFDLPINAEFIISWLKEAAVKNPAQVITVITWIQGNICQQGTSKETPLENSNRETLIN